MRLLHFEIGETMTIVAHEPRSTMRRMAIATRHLSLVGFVGVGLQILCFCSNFRVTLVTCQARRCFRDLRWAFIPMAHHARKPHFAVCVLGEPDPEGL